MSELRLGQFAALLLTMTAGVYIGFAVGHESQQGVGFDVAFAAVFLIVAASTLVRDPRHALTVLALFLTVALAYSSGSSAAASASTTWVSEGSR